MCFDRCPVKKFNKYVKYSIDGYALDFGVHRPDDKSKGRMKNGSKGRKPATGVSLDTL